MRARLLTVVSLAVCAVLGAIGVSADAAAPGARETSRPNSVAETAATPVPSLAGDECPVTAPNGNMPDHPDAGNPEYIGGYGNDALWTNVWMAGKGKTVLRPYDDKPNGPYGAKWAWFRHVPGELTIEGHRLDAPAPPLEADVPDGYGDRGFQVSGLFFPTPGCWEITGYVGGERLTFVVLVVLNRADDDETDSLLDDPPATPVALAVGAD